MKLNQGLVYKYPHFDEEWDNLQGAKQGQNSSSLSDNNFGDLKMDLFLPFNGTKYLQEDQLKELQMKDMLEMKTEKYLKA